MWSEDKLLSDDDQNLSKKDYIPNSESEDGDVDDHNLDTSIPFMPHDLRAEAAQALVKQIMKLLMDQNNTSQLSRTLQKVGQLLKMTWFPVLLMLLTYML